MNGVHLVGVQDDTNGYIRLYMNGDMICEEVETSATTNGDTWVIGRNNVGGYTYHPDAQIDDARVYNAVLTDAEIRDLYLGTGGDLATPAGCPTIGDVCSDGSVYAGDHPVGGERLYVPPADNSTGIVWNNGNNSGWTVTGATSTSDGAGNTTTIIGTDADSGVGGTQPHQAAQLCADSTAHGHSDWYLPARDEANVLYTNRTAIGGFATFLYWVSTEVNNTHAEFFNFISGTSSNLGKDASFNVRCVRKGGSLDLGSCSSPAGVAGEMVYNSAVNVMQYCNGTDWIGIR